MDEDPIIITVAAAGTPEAATADYICDGSQDDAEINAAIAAAVEGGGAIVRIAAGDYWTTRPIAVLGNGVALEGDPAGGTAIRPAADWQSVVGAEGAELTAAINFVGVDDFAARNLTVEAVIPPGSPPDTPLRSFNGIQAIPTGALGSGDICTNGVFEGNTIRLAQDHNYSLWSLRSEGMRITGNTIEGGATLANTSTAQEGIECYGGRDILISGNTISGIGNAAINLGGVATQTPDSSVEDIVVVDNNVTNARVGVSLSTTWGPDYGAADARNIVIENNDFKSIFEVGFLIRNWTGNIAAPPEMSGIAFRDNDVQMLHAQSAGFSPAGLWFFDATAPGETARSDIVVEDNRFTTSGTDALPASLWLSPGHAPFAAFQFFSDVSFRGNDLDLSAASVASRGIYAFDSTRLDVSGNTIRGAGIYPIEFHGTSNFSIDDNILSDWGRGTSYSGILVDGASDYSVDGNELQQLTGGTAVHAINLNGIDQPSSVAGNILTVEQSATLANSVIQHLTLSGDALNGTGNDLANVITGNELGNILNGGLGADDLYGLGGDDVYYVDDSGDRIIESTGSDGIYTSVSYRLAPGQAIEMLAAVSADSIQSINLTGNEFGQAMGGNAGANILNGGGGADFLYGFGGNDTYYVQSASARIFEAAGGGSDTVLSSTSYALSADQEVEMLAATDRGGTVAINLSGNDVAQAIGGNAGANILNGGGGADFLYGFDGDDVYYVDDAGDRVIEGAAAGSDGVYSSTSYVLAGGEEIEMLAAADRAGTAAIDLTGNEFGQAIGGNAGANLIDGGGGADFLYGFGGDDVFAFTSAPGPGNADRLFDFETGIDMIALDDAVFSGLGIGPLSSGAFVAGTSAQDADDHIIYDSVNGRLYYDADGNGAAAAILFAITQPGSTLSDGDFFVM